MKAPRMTLAAVALTSVAALPSLASAQQTPWSGRIALTEMHPADESDPFGPYAADAIHINNKMFPEIDVYYGFTKSIVAELVLTYPQQQEVTLAGRYIGTFRQLPPTLLAQYHFLPGRAFDPYVGAGVNFTWITDADLLNHAVDLKHSSWGAAGQVGVDMNLDKQWFLNLDIKYMNISTDLLDTSGNRLTTVTVNPLLYSLGVGYHF